MTLTLTMILELTLWFIWVQRKGKNLTRTRHLSPLNESFDFARGQVKAPAKVLVERL